MFARWFYISYASFPPVYLHCTLITWTNNHISITLPYCFVYPNLPSIAATHFPLQIRRKLCVIQANISVWITERYQQPRLIFLNLNYPDEVIFHVCLLYASFLDTTHTSLFKRSMLSFQMHPCQYKRQQQPLKICGKHDKWCVFTLCTECKSFTLILCVLYNSLMFVVLPENKSFVKQCYVIQLYVTLWNILILTKILPSTYKYSFNWSDNNFIRFITTLKKFGINLQMH